MTRARFHRRSGTARDLVAGKRPSATRPARRPPRPSPRAAFGRPAAGQLGASPSAGTGAEPAPHGNGAHADFPAVLSERPALRAFDRLRSASVRSASTDIDADPDLLLDSEARGPLRVLTTYRYSIPVVAGVLVAVVAVAVVIIFTGVSLQEAKDPDPTVARIPEGAAADLELTGADGPASDGPASDAADTAAAAESSGAAAETAPAPSEPGPGDAARDETSSDEPAPVAVAPPPEEPMPEESAERPVADPAEPEAVAPAAEAAADPLAPLRDWPNVVTYTVQPGDDWAILGARFNTNANAIIAYNDIADPTHLFFGDVLQIPVGFPVVVMLPLVDPHEALREWPRIATFTVTAATTLTALANEFLTTPAAIVEYNELDPAAPLPVGETLRIPWGFTLALP